MGGIAQARSVDSSRISFLEDFDGLHWFVGWAVQGYKFVFFALAPFFNPLLDEALEKVFNGVPRNFQSYDSTGDEIYDKIMVAGEEGMVLGGVAGFDAKRLFNFDAGV